MPAGGFKTFVAGEILTAADTNSFLMQGVLVFADAAARDAAITSPVEGQFVFRTDEDVLEFFDGTEFVEVSGEPGSAVISATTGSPTETTIVDGGVTFDVFQFTGDGTITVAEAGFADIVFVGGGAGGGNGLTGTGQRAGGGGGAGGYLEDTLFLTAGTVTVTVGSGGAGAPSLNTSGRPGNSSKINPYISVGGGPGAQFASAQLTGGSTGGAGSGGSNTGAVAFQGNIGGNGASDAGGGGGGASAVGADALTNVGGNGGAGLASSITGSSVTRGGGGGGAGLVTNGTGGAGGGGSGGNPGASGTASTGGGGGGGFTSSAGGNGGSGIIIVRVAV